MNEKVTAVQKMQEYIGKHYREEITPTELSKVSAFSPWYARRIFIELTGLSPSDYIRRLRLSKSALMLRDDNCRVIDAALDMGFGSVDGYQRAFFKEFGCNPKEYAQSPVPIFLFTPFTVLSDDSEKRKESVSMENFRNVFIQVVEKPERKVIIKRGVKADEYFAYCEEVGCDVWGLLTSIKSLEGEPVCMWLPEKYRSPAANVYVQGAEVGMDYAGPVPEGFDVITLPKASYVRFQGEPFEEKDFETAILELREAEKRFNPENLGYKWDDSNPKIQLEPIGARGYIELIPVRK